MSSPPLQTQHASTSNTTNETPIDGVPPSFVNNSFIIPPSESEMIINHILSSTIPSLILCHLLVPVLQLKNVVNAKLPTWK